MTKIEWTDRTWNPTTGCDRVSPGCDHCYALTLARRLKAMGSAKYQRDGDSRTSGPGFGVSVHEDVLSAPLRWQRPCKVFVNSTSDLFHKDVPTSFIARVFAVMAATSQHTYQLLTKRPGRMRSLLSDERFFAAVAEQVAIDGEVYSRELVGWPLPNVWLGVSVEDQKRADLRIPALLDTPAAIRFVSAEPLLGPIDFGWCDGVSALGPDWTGGATAGTGAPHPLLDWVICGGESGPGARRMELEWVAGIVRQCKHDDVPVFVKQLGSAHGPHKGGDIDTWPAELQVRECPTAVTT